jgi:HEAT repeat protein
VARGAEPAPRAPGEAREAWRRALASALAQASAALAQQLAAEEKPDAALLRDLASSDARVRDLAVRTLADRKSADAVPALLQRLQDADDTVVERAVGALAQIGDPRAVGPLIELTHRRDGAFVARMTRIVAEIGGPEAEAYLSTLAAGHPEERVRLAAAESLAVVQERSRRAGAPLVGAGESGAR